MLYRTISEYGIHIEGDLGITGKPAEGIDIIENKWYTHMMFIMEK